MKKVTIYTSNTCPYCHKAKEILKSKNVPYNEVLLQMGSDEMMQLVKKTRMRTVPQIFVEDTLIGGCSDLEKLVLDGKFDELVK